MADQLVATDRARARGDEEAATSCIVCGSSEIEPFLDLGVTALANKFLTAEELGGTEAKFPLIAGFCEGCGHVQLTERVPPSAMFEDYLYISSASETLKRHLFGLSDVVVARYPLGSNDLVVDIGCNDGTLLRGFRRHGPRALGVDPAKNLSELFDDPDIDRYTGFFDSRSAAEIRDRFGTAAVITATNTFPHIPRLADFIAGIRTVLAPDGVFVIEAHYVVDMLEQGAFDTIYHEHVSYWALGPMVRLFAENGMTVVHAERLPVHHGQLRVFVQHAGRGEVSAGVREILEAEAATGIDRIATYRRFADGTRQIKADLEHLVSERRADGERIAGYGAPAKGNTLLGYLELGPAELDFIADRSPLKQGLFTPGSHIPVVPPERILSDQPEYLLLLAWNFADEVMEQQSEYRGRGGRFIVPVPEVRII